jgi:hypothetical protein
LATNPAAISTASGSGPRGAAPRRVGRYAVFGEIAKGGMATVYYGRLLGPVGFSRTVAVKQLHPQFASDPEFVEGFVQEAKLAARVHHPNVVQTLDVVSQDGEVVLVMDYVHGESLAKLVSAARARQTRIPLRIVATVIASVLWGLHAAHEAKDEHGVPLGLVHRDMSPQNVLVGADGVARVLDFGIAKSEAKAQNTRDGVLKGKLSYMAPEQVRAGSVTDRRVDVYATAVVAWELITLTKLFRADDQFELFSMVRDNRVRRASDVIGSVPADLEEIVMKGLAAAPEDRWATAKEFAIALENAVPPATPREVGEWVAGLCREVLGERQRRVEELEAASAKLPANDSGQARGITTGPVIQLQTGSFVATTSTGSIPPAAVGGTNPTLNMPAPEPAPRRGNATLVIAALIVLVGGLGGAMLAMRGGGSREAAGAGARGDSNREAPAATRASDSNASAAAATTASAPAASASASSQTVASPTTSSSAERAPVEPAPSSTKKKKGPKSFGSAFEASTSSVGAAPSVPATAAPVAAANCSPPFTVDESGIRHPKPECL